MLSVESEVRHEEASKLVPWQIPGATRERTRQIRCADGPYPGALRAVVTVDDVRAFASTLPRSYEALVRGRVKFRIGRIVYLSFSRDGTVMGFAFPKEWRDALVEAEPEKFSLPGASDMRYHWVHVSLAAIDEHEMRELVEEAWASCVPKSVVQQYVAEGTRATGSQRD
jgi:hypothetical protein